MNYSILHLIKDSEREINVKNRVPIKEMEAIVDFVVTNVFPNGIYEPARFDYYLWLGVLATFTDFPASELTQDELYDLFDDSVFIDKLGGIISATQLNRITCSANKLIEIKLNKHPMSDFFRKANELIDDLKVGFSNLFENEEWTNAFKELFSKENIALLLQYISSMK